VAKTTVADGCCCFVQVDAHEIRDLNEDEIVKRLRKAGGADYNGGRG